MLDTEDIKKLIEAQKEVFYAKEEMDTKFEELKADYSKLQTSVDRIAASNNKFDQEQTIQIHRIDKLEDWVKPVGKKLDMPLAL